MLYSSGAGAAHKLALPTARTCSSSDETSDKRDSINAPDETKSGIAWKLGPSRRISAPHLKRKAKEQLEVYSLYPFDDDMLFFADGDEGMRAFSLMSGQLLPHDPCQLKPVYKIAFHAPTDTLVLVIDHFWLASLRRNVPTSDEWLEVDRTQLPPNLIVNEMSLCGSRVLIGCWCGDELYAYEVIAEHHLRRVGTIPLPKQILRFAVTHLDGDTLVALSHGTSVSLHLLDDTVPTNLRLKRLYHVALDGPVFLLFHHNMLLIADSNQHTGTHAIVQFRASGRQLAPPQGQVLLDAKDSFNVCEFCVAGERLVICDIRTKDLHVYDIDQADQTYP